MVRVTSVWAAGLTVDPDDSLADLLDSVIDVIDDATGVDLELDFLDYLGR